MNDHQYIEVSIVTERGHHASFQVERTANGKSANVRYQRNPHNPDGPNAGTEPMSFDIPMEPCEPDAAGLSAWIEIWRRMQTPVREQLPVADNGEVSPTVKPA